MEAENTLPIIIAICVVVGAVVYLYCQSHTTVRSIRQMRRQKIASLVIVAAALGFVAGIATNMIIVAVF